MRGYALAAVVAAASMGATANATTVVNGFGSGVRFSNYDCNLPSTSRCVVSADTLKSQTYAGGANTGVLTSAENIDGLGGSAAARVQFNSSYLPDLGVSAYAGATSRTASNAAGFQVFTYSGKDPIQLALNGLLDFQSSGLSSSNNAYGQASVTARVTIIPVDKLSLLPQDFTGQDLWNAPLFNFTGCGQNATAASLYAPLTASGSHLAKVGLSKGCDGAPILLNPGDSFIVHATLQAVTNRGGYADAMHTFAVAFDPEHTFFAGTNTAVGSDFFRTNMVAASALPEPATWAMMIGGFGMVGGSMRYRRRQTKVAFATA